MSLMPENSEVSEEINPFQCKSCKNMQEIEIAEDCHEQSHYTLKSCNFYGTEIEMWAGFGLAGSTEKNLVPITAQRKLERLQFSTSSSFVKI